MELRATIIYFIKECDEQDEDKLRSKVHQLKPYFSEEKIYATIAELRGYGII